MLGGYIEQEREFMRGDLKLAMGVVAVAGALALPASASADITVSTQLPSCIWTHSNFGTTTLSYTLSGGTPGAEYLTHMELPGGQGAQGDAGGTFDASGTAAITLKGIYPPDSSMPTKSYKETIVVSQSDETATTPYTPVASLLVSSDAVEIPTSPFNMHKTRLISASGQTLANKSVTGFVTNKAGTKVLKRFALGKANVCGYVARKEVVAPGRLNGNFRLYVDPGTKFNKKLAVSATFGVFGDG
jgi:hypothetical protein